MAVTLSVLIFGAQDTTASALSRVIYLLSRRENQALQARIRKEILPLRDVLEGDNLRYEDVENLTLLDAILKETLRL